METKRLFFGMGITAPWPESLPQGRLLDETHRHLTLVFLGNTDFEKLKETLSTLPPPPFKVGFVGQFDQCLFLPPKHPRVVAWHVAFLEKASLLKEYYQTFIEWLKESGFFPQTHHRFTPHVTLARAPFNERVWQNKFSPLPLMLHDIHLYESVGHLKYEPRWTHPLLPPFEEISHTADVAFWVRGENFVTLFLHASVALSFLFPPLLPYLKQSDVIENLDEVIMALNDLIARVDQEMGCPFKAVSFHSHLEEKEELLQWEMIIDV